ncbi:MAG: metal-dependent hydrolase [Planctomycetaceae bacterium]
MTLPEHLICSVMIAQLGCRQKFGWKSVPVVAVAGIAPDADVATKLLSEPLFWKLHHALGHSFVSIVGLSALIAGVGARLVTAPFRPLFGWCLLAGCVHVLTDIPYWWGVQFLWPFSDWEPTLRAVEYLDLLVLGIAIASLSLYAGYVLLRWLLPQPTGWLHQITGGWMYLAPGNTPVLDWW